MKALVLAILTNNGNLRSVNRGKINVHAIDHKLSVH